jgi:hypothetical protein
MAQIQGSSRNSASLNTANVTTEGQLTTRSITATETEHAVAEGLGFSVYTGVINLTDAARVALLYLQNNDDSDILLTSATIGSGASTGGANNIVLVESVGNVLPTDDIVQNGSDVVIINRNGGAARQFDGVAKTGPRLPAVNGVATGGELSDFTDAQQIDLTTVVPRGGSLALEVQAPTGNTSMDISVSISFHIIEKV